MKSALFVVAALVLCACTPAPSPSGAPATPQVADALDLQPLANVDMQGLNGELGCSFNVGQDTLLLAMGFVAAQEPAEAAVKRRDVAVKLIATKAGGYDVIVEGATSFATDGLTVEVRTGTQIPTTHEQVEYNATLTARDGEGGERAYEGVWVCGP